MAVTQNTYTGNGSTVLYSFTFPYLDPSHIQVEVNGASTTAYTLANATTIQFTTPPGINAPIRIYRETPDTQLLSTFFPGSAIRAQDLNEDLNQSLYIAQESRNDIANAVAGQIPDGSIGTSKIADLAVTSAKLQDQIFTTPKITDQAVTTAKIADQAVTTAKIADGTIINADVNASAGISASKLSFTQAGVSASVRTVESKLRDVVNVKDFGATGNGITDDTAAIQAAINYVQSFYVPETYASSSPGPGVTELFFPFGVYKITAALNVARSMSFRGEGHSEFSVGARILQYTAATDHFRVNPIAQGCSVSWDDLTMTAAGNGGTAGSCINITKTTATCNSVRIRRCTFGTPQVLAIKIQASDDIMISDNLFDVSASGVISLGTATAGDVVSNCQVIGNTFYSIASSAILAYNVDGLVVSGNRVYPSASNLVRFLDGYNTLPYQLKNITVTGNAFKGINCIANLTAVAGFVFQGNMGSALGAGSGASLSCIELTGSCSGVNISGNTLSGTFDTKNFYSSAGATVSSASIGGNTLINTGGTGVALFSSNTSGNIDQSSMTGFVSPCVGQQFFTTGNAISVGVISSLTAATYTTTVSGASQGDKVTLTPSSTSWPVPVGVTVSAFVSAANTVSIRYANNTGSAIGVPAHDFGILVTR